MLIVDEVGYIPFDPQAANLMFMLVSCRQPDRHQQQALLGLGQIFGDDTVAAAMIDRLVHHACSHELQVAGDRFRNYIDLTQGAPL